MNSPIIAFRIKNGQHLFNTIAGSHAFHFSNDHPENEHEAQEIGDFAQDIQDDVDLWDTFEAKQRVIAQFEIDAKLQELSDNGFLVFGCQQKQKRKFLDKIDTWLVAYIVVLRKKNHLTKRKGEDLEQIAQDADSPQDEFTNFITIGRQS